MLTKERKVKMCEFTIRAFKAAEDFKLGHLSFKKTALRTKEKVEQSALYVHLKAPEIRRTIQLHLGKEGA